MGIHGCTRKFTCCFLMIHPHHANFQTSLTKTKYFFLGQAYQSYQSYDRVEDIVGLGLKVVNFTLQSTAWCNQRCRKGKMSHFETLIRANKQVTTGSDFIELLKQITLLKEILLGRNEQDTSQRCDIVSWLVTIFWWAWFFYCALSSSVKLGSAGFAIALIRQYVFQLLYWCVSNPGLLRNMCKGRGIMLHWF